MDESMTACKRDAFTARIDKSIESLNASISSIVGSMRGINERLLPPSPTCEGESAKNSGPQGWLEQTLSELENIHRVVNVLRGAINELYDAVEAGKVKQKEVR